MEISKIWIIGDLKMVKGKGKPWEAVSWSPEGLPVFEEPQEMEQNKNIKPWMLQSSSMLMPKTSNKEIKEFSSYLPQPNKVDFNKVFDKLIQAESRGRHRDSSGKLTTSPVGAKGITQVMRKTGQDPGYGVAPLKDQSEAEYIRFGRDYLQAMLKEFNGDYPKALAAYNAGPGNVKKAIRKAKNSGGNWTDYLPKKSETIPYIKKILGSL